MENITINKLSGNSSIYYEKLEEYYRDLNRQTLKKKPKAKGKKKSSSPVIYGVSPEFGLQQFIKEDDKTLRVEELRLPILIDGKLWIKKIKDFIAKTEIDYLLSQTDNQLLEDNIKEVHNKHEYIYGFDSTPAALRPHLDNVKYNISEKLGKSIHKEQIIVDIYSWDPENSELQLIVILENSEKVEPNIINNILKANYPTLEFRLINYKEIPVNQEDNLSLQDTREQSILKERFVTLKSLNKVVYRLIDDIDKLLKTDTEDELKMAKFKENINQFHLNILVQKYLEIIKGKTVSDSRYTSDDIKFITTYLKKLAEDISFNKGSLIGSLVSYKGKIGVIIDINRDKYTIKIEGTTVKADKKSLKTIIAAQNFIHKLENRGKIRYIDASDLTIRNITSLSKSIYNELIKIKPHISYRYVESVFSIGLDSGYYLGEKGSIYSQKGGLGKKAIIKYITNSKKKGLPAYFSLNLKKPILKKRINKPYVFRDDELIIGGVPYENIWTLNDIDGKNWMATLEESNGEIKVNIGTQFDLVKNFLDLSITKSTRESISPPPPLPDGSPSPPPLPDDSPSPPPLPDDSPSPPPLPDGSPSPPPLPDGSPSPPPLPDDSLPPSPPPSPPPLPDSPQLPSPILPPKPSTPQAIPSLSSSPSSLFEDKVKSLTYNIVSSNLVLQNGDYTEIDLKSRPYILNYNIETNKSIRTNIMGCGQSSCLKTACPASMRPNRKRSRKTKKEVDNPLHLQKKIFLELDKKNLATEDKFVLETNYYDKISNTDKIIVDTDIIILTDSNEPLGFLTNENISDLQKYPLLNRSTVWRNSLLTSSNSHPFVLDGFRWHSINTVVHFGSLNPIFTRSFPEINQTMLYEYDKLFREGLTLKGKTLLSNLRNKYNYGEPEYCNLTIDEINQKYTVWFKDVLIKLGLESGSIIDTYGDITFKNFILKRAYYSKISTNTDLKDLLISTGEANLVNKQSFQSIYETNNALLETRYYLANNITNLIYNNLVEKALESRQNFIKKIENGVINWIKTRKVIPTLQELELEPIVVLGKDSKSSNHLENYRELLPIVVDQNKLYFFQVFEQVKTSRKDESKIAKKTMLEEQYRLKILSLFGESKSPTDDISDDIPWGTIYQDSEIFKTFTAIQIEMLNSYLSDINLIGYDVPPDGDCLFHSLIDQLNYKNLIPMKPGEDKIYNRETQLKDLSITVNGYVINEITYVKAGMSARSDIAGKILANMMEIYLTSEGHSTSVKQAVELELRETEPKYYSFEPKDDNENFLKYIDLLKNSCVADNLEKGVKTGIWGGQIEIWAAAALYNINIRVFTLDVNGNLDNSDGELYTAEVAREKFPQGKVYNEDSLQGEINIAWLSLEGSSAHYISLRKSQDCLKYLITSNGSVKRHVSESVILKVGDNFDPNSGKFNIYEEAQVDNNSTNNDTMICYFTLPQDQSQPKNVYYFGKQIGTISGKNSGISFI